MNKSDILSSVEICGYCGSKIIWDIDDKDFKYTKEDKEREDEYDYIVCCSNSNCKYHKHEYIGDMEYPSFCQYKLEQEELERKHYIELKEQVKLWINDHGQDFSTKMSKGEITNHNCPIYYKLLKDNPCDYKCKECWDRIVDKLKGEEL